MPALLIYSPQFKNDSGKVVRFCLEISAANKFGYYKPYPYFASHLSIKPISRLTSDFKESTSNELLARSRRVVIFADTTELQPVKFSKKYYGSLAEKSRKGMHCDHLSYWKSAWGSRFILNEPYWIDEDYVVKLEAQGLAVIELPVNFSPYCGSWNDLAGTQPWTRSFLICNSFDKDELEAINCELKTQISMAWNSTEGISHE